MTWTVPPPVSLIEQIASWIAQNGSIWVPLPGPGQTNGIVVEPAAPITMPGEKVIINEEMQMLEECIAALKPDYREVIVLRNLERLSFNDVAERMDRSRPAVQMLWMRAIKKLQETLGEEDPE